MAGCRQPLADGVRLDRGCQLHVPPKCLAVCNHSSSMSHPNAPLTPGAAGALQVGEGEFGIVYKAKYLGTMVAVKVLKNNDAVALGDFR